MERSPYIIIPACCFMLLLCIAACSPRIYRPPALGAEYRFDEELKPAKHPSTLFDKKMSRYLQDRGIERKASPAKVSSVASHPKDSAAPGRVATDSGRKATPTTLTPATSPASSDSFRNGRD